MHGWWRKKTKPRNEASGRLGSPHHALLTATAALVLAACSSGAEEAVLSHFFSAARLRDETALSSFAVASFEPNEQGVVSRFEITSVSTEHRKPLNVTAFAEPHQDAGAETAVAAMSVEDASNPIDVTKYDGEMVSKDVTISAPVRLPSGQTVQKTLVVTMQRAILKGEKKITGRWVITGIKDATAAAKS